jgi:sterol desaturase/sphingolipid hydroxylase (fatty acid hydroxylase superfamily)
MDIFQSLETSLLNLSLIFLAITLAEIAIDFFSHKQRDYRETGANIGIGIVTEAFINRFSGVVIIIGLSSVSAFVPWTLPLNIWTLLLAVLISDFIYYWEHRAEHRIRFFWAYHSVHHSSTDFDLTVALRLSWIEDFILWIFYIPMVFMGFHPLLVLVSIEIVGLYQVWIHTQKIGRLGILDAILNTASNHRVHHGANPAYIDKNYGGILMLWDKWFGTYQSETEQVMYGLTENIGTHNPLKINVIEYLRMAADWRRSSSLQEKFLSLFGAPEWKPSAAKR